MRHLCLPTSILIAAFVFGLTVSPCSVDAQTIDLTVDQSQSSLTFTVLGSTDSSSITGSGAIVLTPSEPPFSTAQFTELDLTVADGFSISLLAGLVNLSSDPNSSMLTLLTPGLPGAVDGSNQFTQTNNIILVSGEVALSDPFGLVGGSMNFVLEDNGPTSFDIVNAMISVDGDQVTLESSIDITVANDAISVNAAGTIVLTGTLPKDLLGDVNCDGIVDLLDVAPFVDLLTTGGFSDKADINGDLVVDLLDVGPFVDLVSGG